MTYEYVLTFADYKAAQRLFIRQTTWRRIKYFFFLTILPAMGFAALIALLYDVIFRHFSFPSSVGGALAGIAWAGLYCAIMRPIQLRRLFRQLRPGSEANHPVSLQLTDSELISRIPGKSEGRFFPSAFYGFAEDEKIAIILVNKKTFLFIPKHAMPSEEWARLRNWLGKKAEA